MDDLNPEEKFSAQKDQLVFPAKVGVDSPLYSDRVSPDFLMHRVRSATAFLAALFCATLAAHSGVTRAATLEHF
jgi:hypothetical protein